MIKPKRSEVMYKVSVIIPVYNAESNLKAAIDSVINQTIGFHNVELILVDDYSNDSSKLIIKNYINQYNNIQGVFFDKNTGSPVKPRNIGMANSTGKYLMFLDSDDLLVKDCLETLYDIAEREDSDLVQCIYLRKIDGEYYVYNYFNEKNKDYVIVEDILKLRGTVWGNLFKSSLIKNKIKFEDVLHEDGLFLLNSSIAANKIIYLPNFYGYIYNLEDSNSLTHSVSLNSIKKYIQAFKLQNELLIKNNISKEELFNSTIPMIYFMFFKFKGKYKDKMDALKQIHDFEMELKYNVKLRSKPIDWLNKLVLKENYLLAIFLSWIASKVYNNNFLKNSIFKRYSQIKKLDFEK